MNRPKKQDYCKYLNDRPDWSTFDMNAYSIDNDKYIDHLESKDNSVLHSIIDSHTCKMELIKTAKYENPKPEDNAWGYGCKTCGKYTHLNYPQSFIKELLRLSIT